MADARRQVAHAPVVVRRFARKANQEIPQRRDADLLAPLEELDVLQSGHALLHQLQDRVAEALDAGLDRRHARLAQQADLILLQVRLGLVEERHVEAAPGELRQQRFEVFEIEDVVDDLDVATRMRLREVGQLVECPRRRLAPVRHRRAVETAEGAVHPLAPPAAARRFDEHARLPHAPSFVPANWAK